MAHCEYCKQEIRLGPVVHRCAGRDAAAKEESEARQSAAACSVEVDLTDAENTALGELCAQMEMTRQGVMLVALRLYQAVALGAAEVTWKPAGPIGCMGDDCPPNSVLTQPDIA